MLCAKCHEREATVYHTVIAGDNFEKIDLCVTCAGPLIREEKSIQVTRVFHHAPARSGEFVIGLPGLPDETSGYPIEAYEFVSEALDFCHDEWPVSGREWLDSIRLLAVRKFGGKAKSVFRNWKIHGTKDFGEIIFSLIDTEQLKKRFKGSREEFENGFDFDEAFPES